MKCVKEKDGSIKRLRNEDAAKAVKNGAAYCPKSEWKAKK